MTVFKTFWKIVKKYKGTIILYTVMLIAFGGINQIANENETDFVNSKPNVIIVNNDEEKGLTKNLIDYIKNNSNIIDIKNTEEARNDAIFFRDANYIIYIPNGYRNDILKGLNPEIEIKSSGDYQSSLAEMILTRYLKTQSIYNKEIKNETELINTINKTLKKKSIVEISSKLNTDEITKISRFFNFASYSIMAVILYIICLVLYSFNKDIVKKRTIISSMNYKKHNKLILFASSLFALLICILYMILSIILFKESMITTRGLIYLLNTFIFTFTALTLALLVSSLVNSKEAISGIVNVVALGSAFLCGAFIPVEFLPEQVLKIARILPAYWYINSNELLKTTEILNLSTLKPILIDYIVMIIFGIIFIIINNLIAKKKRVY